VRAGATRAVVQKFRQTVKFLPASLGFKKRSAPKCLSSHELREIPEKEGSYITASEKKQV
jgi:hypothetical protein